MGGAQAVDLKFSLVSIGIKLKNYFPHPSLPSSLFFPFTDVSQGPAHAQHRTSSF